MGAVTSLGTAFQKEVNRVAGNISNELSNIYNIELYLARENESTEISPLSREIQRITIIQDFATNYTDKIIVDLQLNLATYQWLILNRSDLYARVMFTKVDPNEPLPKYREPEYSEYFKAILLTQADPSKLIPSSVTKEHGSPHTPYDYSSFNVKLELMDVRTYQARKKRFNACLRGDGERGVTMDSIIKYAIARFGFTKASVVVPDNKTKYVNFVIPPVFGIDDLMEWLQKSPGHGVYNNGFCSYITNGVWFVWPRYGGYISKRAVQLYKLSPNMWNGLKKYDWQEVLSDGDVTTHILVPGNVEETNYGQIGYENRPNMISMQITDQIVDNCRTLLEDGKFRMEPQLRNVAVIPHKNDTADTLNNINYDFRYSHGNTFSKESEVVAFDQTTLRFSWNACRLFTFTPGTVVKYLYEHMSGTTLSMKVMTGACESVTYVFEKDEGSRLYPYFKGTADVTICCSNMLAREQGIV